MHSPSHTSAKRRRCMPMTLAPSTPPSRLNNSAFSPFVGVVKKLTTEEITTSISQEVRRLHKRRQLHYASSSLSPTQASSAVQLEKQDDVASCSSPEASPMSQSLSNILNTLPSNKKDAPLFTFRQVSMICERLVHEREEEVKEQYDKILNCKMAEQYESFLKFNHDQLQRRFGHSEMSYVS